MSARRDRLRRGRRHGGPAKALLIILGVLVAAGLAAGIAGAGYVYSTASDAPSISDLKPLAKGESSVVYAADGTKLGTIESDIQRTPVASRIAWGMAVDGTGVRWMSDSIVPSFVPSAA